MLQQLKLSAAQVELLMILAQLSSAQCVSLPKCLFTDNLFTKSLFADTPYTKLVIGRGD